MICVSDFPYKFERSFWKSCVIFGAPGSCRRKLSALQSLTKGVSGTIRLLVVVLTAVPTVVTGGAVAVDCWFWSTPAAAETATMVLFDIPSQPLEAALEAYGARTRIQVLYETPLAANRRSASIKGWYVPATALQLLLHGTGLGFDYTAENAITLMPAKLSNLHAAAEARRRNYIVKFDRFLGGIQAGVMAALCRHPKARPGDFDVAMRFSVNGAGVVVNPALIASTGNAAQDRAILDVLSRLAFSEAPPADMPQPIAMKLTNPRSSGARDFCAEAAPG